MKRSRYVALVGMGAGTLMLAGCEDPNKMLSAKAYPDVKACVADHNSEAACKDAFYAAADGYDSAYPKYANQYDCEANAGDGKCEPDYPNARNHGWRPMMTGFIFATHGSRVQPQPLVSNVASPSGRATAAGVPIAAKGSNIALAAKGAAAPTASQIASAHKGAGKATTIARGGFGSRSASVSSGSRSFGG